MGRLCNLAMLSVVWIRKPTEVSSNIYYSLLSHMLCFLVFLVNLSKDVFPSESDLITSNRWEIRNKMLD